MGCDIHLFKEYRSSDIQDNNWISYDHWHSHGGKEMGRNFDNSAPSRNYAAFGMLAEGVRGEYPYSVECKGLPDDVTYLVDNEHKGWGVDAHSATYFTEVELNKLLIKLSIMNEDNSDVSRQKDYLNHMIQYMNKVLFEFCIEHHAEKRIIFWFDN